MPLKPGRLEQKGAAIHLVMSPDSDDGIIDAIAFADYIRDTIKMVRLNMESVAEEKRQDVGTVRYAITKIKMESPLDALLTPMVAYADKEILETAQRRHVSWAAKIKSGTFPQEMNYAIQRGYQQLSETAAKNRFTTQLTTEGVSAVIDKTLKNTLDLEVLKDQYAKGTLRGYIRAYHSAGKHYIRIYPRGTGPSITCSFSEELHGRAVRNFIDKYVQVQGQVRYRPNAYRPYYMQLRTIEFIDVEKAPRWRDMMGAFANVPLSGKSEDLVRADRDDW